MRIQMKLTRYFINLVLVSSLVLSLSACGFKLRGAIELPAQFQRIFVAGSANSTLVRDLRDTLAYSAEVVESRSEADVILNILREESKTRTLSVGSDGKIREAELQYSIIYSLTTPDGKVLLDKTSLLMVRDFINDENDVIGRSNESAVIQRDLKRDAAQQILNRLQTLGSALESTSH